MEMKTGERTRRKPKTIFLAGTIAVAVALAGAGAIIGVRSQSGGYPEHRDVITTVFWVGEEGDESNAFIHNRSSTWVTDWVSAFGGIDNPDDRCGWRACGFTPRENPFYFALPYNDLDGSCQAKDSQREVPWYEPIDEGGSVIKNRWIEVTHGNRTAYAQWQDAGPFGEDDFDYVFGREEPKSQAGLDISPATADYLRFSGLGPVSWQFVEAEDVPNGPWRQTTTGTPPDCAG